MSAPLPAWQPAQPHRWARLTTLACLGLLALSLAGLALGATGDEFHGFVHAQPWDLPHLWTPVALMSSVAALTAWRRWRILTILVALASVPVVFFSVLVGSIPLGVGRGDPVVSPTGQWALRIDDRGFQDRYYAPIMMERGSLTARYWQVGEAFWPDEAAAPKEVFEAPRWTSDDTVVVRSNRRVLTYRVAVER